MTNRKIAYIVKDQRPEVLDVSASVAQACRAMTEHHVGSVLVVDARKRLVGIFTGRDAVRILATSRSPASAKLAKAMTRDPVTVSPDERALDALHAMENGGFRHVPVVDDGQIWGVISRGDLKGMELTHLQWCQAGHPVQAESNRRLAAILAQRRPIVLPATETVKTGCKAMWKSKGAPVLVVDQHERLAGIFTGRDAVRVLAKAKDPAETPLAKAMTRTPVTIGVHSHAIDALRSMWEGGFRHLPVVEDGRICGCVSRADFTGCELDRIEEEEHLYECLR